MSAAQVLDDFSDGDFTTNPAWSGDAGLFTVSSGQLRSQSPGAANYQLSTPSTQGTSAQWEFFVNLKFATSGANYADVYLMSSAADLASGVDGYYVRIGGTQDRVELFRSDGGAATSLIASADGIVNSSTDNPFRILVKRDASDLWTLSHDDGATGTYTVAGSVVEATYGSCSHFGIRIEQSSAASAVNNHFFDDFAVGPIVLDITPPIISAVQVIAPDEIDVVFDEPVEQSSAENSSNYNVQPFLNATSAVRDGVDLARVHLTLTFPLQSGGNYVVFATGVEDLSGNATVNAQFPFNYFVPASAQFREMVINEILADPTPTVGLPEAEFLELYNSTTTKTFDLGGWTIGDGSTTGTMPGIIVPPGGYVIVTDDSNAGLFTGFGTVVSVPTFPSLNNDSDPLELRDDNGTLVDTVTYDVAWFADAVKDDGGWTLEQRNPVAPCSGDANWTASNAAVGGTPGAENSVFDPTPDSDPPVLVTALVNSATELVLVFNEALDVSSIPGASYLITPSLAIGTVNAGVGPLTTVEITLLDPMITGEQYTVSVSGISDCAGNTIVSANTAVFALPDPALPGDLVINEVLYDPRVGGSDFVELYNRSNNVLSLAGMRMANEEDGQIANPTVITQASILLLPGEYILLTEDPFNIAAEYPQGRTDRFLLCDLPSYNNGEGAVVLQDPLGITLDLFRYTDDLHFPLINDIEGVSLERVDPARPSDEPTNWHSAAETAGWATPGLVNSQFSIAPSASGEMTIDPAIFSPDNDGYQDLLTITYRFDEPGFVGSLTVYDLAGREMKRLMENTLLGEGGSVSWNGIMSDGDLARIGPYVVYFEVFDLAGNTLRLKKTITLAQRLN